MSRQRRRNRTHSNMAIFWRLLLLLLLLLKGRLLERRLLRRRLLGLARRWAVPRVHLRRAL